ncbi:hypothetical protein KAS08_01500, partial [Candidatus Pacearchaeota archaeon]|nr:hypothetical protein [Candidatus Pacearchaeota archaeon]
QKKEAKQNNSVNQNINRPMGPPNLPPPLNSDAGIANARNNVATAFGQLSPRNINKSRFTRK